jgi:hypothetical protein
MSLSKDKGEGEWFKPVKNKNIINKTKGWKYVQKRELADG